MEPYYQLLGAYGLPEVYEEALADVVAMVAILSRSGTASRATRRCCTRRSSSARSTRSCRATRTARWALGNGRSIHLRETLRSKFDLGCT